jgi:hypothetical protein
MAHHIGITSTHSITLPSGAIAQDVRRTKTVAPSEVIGTSGEYENVKPLKQMKVDVVITGVGPAPLSSVTSGNVAPPSTMKALNAEQGEKSTGDNRATFTLNSTAMESFSDSAGSPAAAGAGDPDEDTLGIVSITLALAETLSVRREVKDVNVPATNGTPGARGTCCLKNTISVRGRGDIPASLTMGSDGIAVAGLSDGVTLVGKLEEGQKADDINDWAGEAGNYPEA